MFDIFVFAVKLIETYLVQLAYNDEMYITFWGKILLYDSRLLKTVDEIGGKIIKKILRINRVISKV